METTHGKTHSENGEGECWWYSFLTTHPSIEWRRGVAALRKCAPICSQLRGGDVW